MKRIAMQRIPITFRVMLLDDVTELRDQFYQSKCITRRKGLQARIVLLVLGSSIHYVASIRVGGVNDFVIAS